MLDLSLIHIFIVRADVIYMKALFTEMLGALHQETGKVIEFIILQIDACLLYTSRCV